MKPVAETIATFGVPVFMHTMGDGSSPSAVIARWRHAGGEIDISASDTVRFAISLQDGQYVRVQRGKAASSANLKIGSVSVVPAHERTKMAIRGETDVLVIFLRETFLDAAVEGKFSCSALFNSHDSELRAAAMQLFVAATRGDPDDSLLLESGVHRLAARLLVDHGDHLTPAPARGGLARAAHCRVDDMITAAHPGPTGRRRVLERQPLHPRISPTDGYDTASARRSPQTRAWDRTTEEAGHVRCRGGGWRRLCDTGAFWRHVQANDGRDARRIPGCAPAPISRSAVGTWPPASSVEREEGDFAIPLLPHSGADFALRC